MFNNIQVSIIENTKKALDINKSIWVSASAGSGKTTILVNRLLNLLLNGVDIKKIICITYTNNAANEMKERIYNILEKWMVLDKNELKIEINKTLYNTNISDETLNNIGTLFINIIDNIDNLKIFTIHSFCQQIISKFPIEAGILPNFTIIDDKKMDDLVNKSIEYFILNVYKFENINLAFDNILNLMDEISFNKFVKELIVKIKDFNYIDKIDYIEILKKYFDINIEEDEFFIKKSYLKNCYNFNEYKEFLKTFDIENSKNDIFFELLDWIGYDDKIENLNIYFNIFLTKTGTVRKILSKDANSNKTFKEIFLQESEKAFIFSEKLKNIKCFNNTNDIIKIMKFIINIYKNLKLQEGVVDFDDLIMLTCDLLKNNEYSEWVKYKLDYKIEHILLDEAQDTSKEQWQIIDNLSEDFFSGKSANENNRQIFVVGDEKQSIFSFQGAEPELFNEKFQYYKNKINNFEKVNLDYSFRSAKNILSFVDKFYENKELSKKISMLEENIKHNFIRDVNGLVEIWPLVDVEKKQELYWQIDFEKSEEAEKDMINASNIAKKIKLFFDKKKQLTSKNNKKKIIQYRDIMILVEKRTGSFLSFLIQALNKLNIPNSGFDKINLFEDIFIKDLLSLLYFCKFNYDDFNLSTLLKSPILNLNEENLYELCKYKNENNCSLHESLRILKPTSYAFLEDIILKSRQLSIYNLCFYILNEKNIKNSIIERSGNGYREILQEFLLFVKNYENEEICDIVAFLNYIYNNNNEIKKDFNSSELNQVRIMTVHGSKGLQAPIVFIANANKLFSANNGKQSEIFWYKDNFNKINLPLVKKDNISEILKNFVESNKNINIEEKYRLFYVAMTRAENELYICGTSANSKEKNTKNDLENIQEQENYKSFYEIAFSTIKKMNPNIVKFEFDEKLEKIFLGNEEEFDILETETDKKDIEEKKIKEFIEDIKNVIIEKNNEKEEIYNPSQFFKHNDRDKLLEGLNVNILKGNAVHKLLEILPKVDKDNWENISNIYLNNLFNDLSEKDKIIIKNNIYGVLENPDYYYFFNEKSKAEVAIVGEIDGKNFSGQIDRLIELEDKIIILDYKNTSKNYNNSVELPINYIKQLEIYKKIIQKNYINKKIECYILLTAFVKLIKVL